MSPFVQKKVGANFPSDRSELGPNFGLQLEASWPRGAIGPLLADSSSNFARITSLLGQNPFSSNCPGAGAQTQTVSESYYMHYHELAARALIFLVFRRINLIWNFFVCTFANYVYNVIDFLICRVSCGRGVVGS